MKKWLAGIIIIVLLITGALIYWLIPNFISFDHSVSFKANHQGLYRVLLDEKNWVKWWPGNEPGAKNYSPGDYYYNGNKYTVDSKKISSIFINIDNPGSKAVTALHLLPLPGDSVKIAWVGNMATSYNPLKRVKIYWEAKKLKSDIRQLTEKMRSYYSEPKNIYGTAIRQVAVVDSVLISTYGVSKGYPSTEFVYGLIDQLKKYIIAQSAKETGFPMLNVFTKDSINYEVKVAIPVDKRLKSSGTISYKWMLGGGNILVTEVNGGPYTIQKTFRQIESYMTDYHRIPVAIPFQSLITDRRNEPDTSKWVTKIYYPVI